MSMRTTKRRRLHKHLPYQNDTFGEMCKNYKTKLGMTNVEKKNKNMKDKERQNEKETFNEVINDRKICMSQNVIFKKKNNYLSYCFSPGIIFNIYLHNRDNILKIHVISNIDIELCQITASK